MKAVLLVIILSATCALMSRPLNRHDLIARQSAIVDHGHIDLGTVLSLLVRGAAYLENGDWSQAEDDLNAAKCLIPKLSTSDQHLALENAQVLSNYIQKTTQQSHAMNSFLQCSSRDDDWNTFTMQYWECNQCHNIFLSRPSQCGCGSTSFTRKFSSTDDTI